MLDAMKFGRLHHLWCLVILLITVSGARGLLCYKCAGASSVPSRLSNVTERLCSRFDVVNPLYQVKCPFSTFCMKKSIELQLPGGKTVRSAIRDCAPQKYDYQSYSSDKGWEMQHKVEDSAYEEGCHAAPHQLNVHTPADQYCYCKSNLCNAAKPTHEAAMHHTDAMAVIFVFNAMKYVRSLR